MLNNPLKNSSSAVSSAQNTKLRNLTLKSMPARLFQVPQMSNPAFSRVGAKIDHFEPILAQVPHFCFKFRKYQMTEPHSSRYLSGLIQVPQNVKNDLNKFQVLQVRNLRSVRLQATFSSSVVVNPPYTMGVKIPP